MTNAEDVNRVVVYGQKKRGIAHQICINGHFHLIKEVTRVEEADMTSARLIAKSIDLNQKDSEETTPICFAFRGNSFDIVEYLLSNNLVDLNISSPKYGCPLHLCILKHKFKLALDVLKGGAKVNVHSLNPNGSNCMHILFANFSFGEGNDSERLANSLISHGIDMNLVDNNGLSPIHVAIKKNQLDALKYASKFNMTAPVHRYFSFGVQGKKGFTPLHYSIIKSNYEAFLYILSDEKD
jgi:ankyrin repeat protein